MRDGGLLGSTGDLSEVRPRALRAALNLSSQVLTTCVL